MFYYLVFYFLLFFFLFSFIGCNEVYLFWDTELVLFMRSVVYLAVLMWLFLW
jgi:hypothetical protein